MSELILDRARTVWSGCFRTGTTIIYSVQKHDFNLNGPGFRMLTVGTAIAHWLYFDYICRLE